MFEFILWIIGAITIGICAVMLFVILLLLTINRLSSETKEFLNKRMGNRRKQ